MNIRNNCDIVELINYFLNNSKSVITAHGCNAQGKMGSGVAKSLSDEWPIVKSAYLQYFPYPNTSLVGSMHWVNPLPNFHVFNMITQAYYGRKPNVRYASIDAIEKCFRKLFGFCFNHPDKDNLVMVIPPIGCSLGGLYWDEVSKVIERVAIEQQFPLDSIYVAFK